MIPFCTCCYFLFPNFACRNLSELYTLHYRYFTYLSFCLNYISSLIMKCDCPVFYVSAFTSDICAILTFYVSCYVYYFILGFYIGCTVTFYLSYVSYALPHLLRCIVSGQTE